MRSSRITHNFFPLGRSSGPLNKDQYLKPASTDPGSNYFMSSSKAVARRDVVLSCPQCKYFWAYSRLGVWCAVDKRHRRIERALKMDWIYDQKNPVRSWSQLRTPIDPKDGRWISCDRAANRVHSEPRSVGITSRMMSVLKDRTKLSVKISGLKGSRFHWKTFFPFPC